MAQKSQCENCQRYNAKASICKKTWTTPLFNGQECGQYECENLNGTAATDGDTAIKTGRIVGEGRPVVQMHYIDLAMHLQNKAYNNLRGKWESAIGVYLISIICLIPWYLLSVFPSMYLGKEGLGESFFISSALFFVCLFLFASVLYFGFYNSAVIAIRKNEQFRFSKLFMGFMSIGVYGKVVWQFMVTTFILFLWYLLLIIPGIIKSYSYAMVIFIRRDYPDLSATEVMLSERMMQGHKMDLFVLTIFFMVYGIFLASSPVTWDFYGQYLL